MNKDTLMCTFSYCESGHFHFDREDGTTVEVYNWDVRSAEYNAKETFKDLISCSDCYTVYRNGLIEESDGW